MPALGDLESDCRSFEFDYVVGSWYMNPLAKVSSDSGEIGDTYLLSGFGRDPLIV